MKKVYFIVLVSFLFISCSAIPKRAKYYELKDNLEPFIYEIRDVSVVIDYVEENDIADQFTNFLLTKLSYQQSVSSDIIYIDVSVQQRSFIQDIQQKNSIYITFTGFDENNNIILRENSYYVGKSTFISSFDQYKCGNQIVSNLLKFQKDVQNIYIKNNEK